ncbi:hypothetical protein ES288_A12G011300v1 [Gossypium darwinii]|uniref:Reverse transcriptase zinc-binding domain-containing protein n=1 Tax=Gossypium darwinii TaxID=34276 RepID=A0A5D2E585_GOSDA|nr:hypothetical protein ES288_A12G011300v1 [Gossypium darwinii]
MDVRVAKWMGDKDFSWKLGNGKTTLFWVDKWCGNGILKQDFPRLFSLAKSKNSSIFDYSFNNGFCNVKWDVLFVRPLLDREMEILGHIIERVSSVILVPEVEDQLLWPHDSKGEFSVKLLSKLLLEGE